MQPTNTNLYNIQQLNTNLLSAYMKYQEVAQVFFAMYSNKQSDIQSTLFQDIYKVMLPVMQFWSNPAIIMPLLQQVASLYYSNLTEPDIALPISSKKFSDPDWDSNPFFAFIKDAYLKQSELMNKIMADIPIHDEKQKKKLTFYAKKLNEAMSPANFALSNPEVIKETIATNGANFVNGMENLLQDLKRAISTGQFDITTIDRDAFIVGENLAVTPGHVVYQNELMQVIQYLPTTKDVYKIPILIVPAWINKFYILDLQATNSYVKWLTEQGYTVFMISWVNPDKSLANKTFEDYLISGAITAIKKVQEITKEPKIHCIGYCLGGTLLSTALAYLAAKNMDVVQSATFLTTLVDFVECGDVDIFIDEPELNFIEELMAKDGFLDGYYLRQTFNMLRAEDMIWSFFINNYLMGKAPRPFDILSWNADSTRLPAAMHSYYLRNLYQKNLLVQPNGLTLDGVKIDLRNIKIPTYILATKDDHIAPWHSAYKALKLYSGKKRFVLSGSGHVAGVVNHPSKEKYCHWTSDAIETDSETWFKNAKESKGSWWTDWYSWIQKQDQAKVPPRNIDTKSILEDAPGSYVKTK